MTSITTDAQKWEIKRLELSSVINSWCENEQYSGKFVGTTCL